MRWCSCWRVPLVLLIVGALSACNPSYYREGVGSSLYDQQVAEATQLEDAYLGYLCRQAGLTLGTGPEIACTPDWPIIVQAGLNDIDRRCDAYLAWLDDRKRSTGPVLQQISDLRTATIAIMSVAGVGVDPIAIVAAAFGLASSTFSNVNSRLLTELDHSTVQATVLNRQTQFRKEIVGRGIFNRPAAVHALRSYLRICMPFTIETDINTTITTLERGGIDALRQKPPLVSAATIGVPMTAVTRVAPPVRPPRVAVEAPFSRYLFNVALTDQNRSFVRNALRALCVRPEDLETGGAALPALIRIFEDADEGSGRGDGRLGQAELRTLNSAGDCVPPNRNYYENRLFKNGMATPGLIDLLNRALGPGQTLRGEPSLEAIRPAIAKVRDEHEAELAADGGAPDQITPGLIQFLRRLPAR